MKEIKGYNRYLCNESGEVFSKQRMTKKNGRTYAYRSKKLRGQKLQTSTDVWFFLKPDGKEKYVLTSQTKIKMLSY